MIIIFNPKDRRSKSHS